MVSLVTQLGLLGIFKYFNFFAESLSVALNSIGIQTSSLHLNIVLPVGISFYTFQSLSYTIDIYRRQFKPTDRFSDFALFVAYFPQLQAGPIERARHLIPQLAKPRQITIDQTSRGLYLIILGFFKKIAIADGVSPVVDQIFSSSGRVTWIDVIVGTVLFAVQIYCDFSGYTDIARGISKLLGINLIVNFDQPYFATNPQDFWRRWHISLSSFHLSKFNDHDAAWRTVAWRSLEFCSVGTLPGRRSLHLPNLASVRKPRTAWAASRSATRKEARGPPFNGKCRFLCGHLLRMALVSRALAGANHGFLVSTGRRFW
jgi:hypothetical protein